MNGVSNPTAPIGINPLTDFAASSDVPSLSPEMLLTYCSSRLEALDTNIKQYFAEQQNRNRSMQELGRLLATLRNWDHCSNSDVLKNDCEGQKNHAAQGNAILEIYRSTNDPQVRAACEDAFKTVTGMDVKDFPDKKAVLPTDIKASAEAGKIQGANTTQWSQKLESIKDTQSSMSKSAEMNMIQLQSLVSQRQLAIQLTTQLMQTVHEGTKQTVANIRA